MFNSKNKENKENTKEIYWTDFSKNHKHVNSSKKFNHVSLQAWKRRHHTLCSELKDSSKSEKISNMSKRNHELNMYNALNLCYASIWNTHHNKYIIIIIIIIIIINSYILVTLIRSTHEKLYAMCIEWTKFSEVENRSLFIRLLHAVEMIKLRLCIKFVCDNCTLENECSCHSKLLQQLRFHHHSHCCSEILRDWDDDLIVREVNVL